MRLLTLILIGLAAVAANAENLYMRSGLATGNHTGLDWDNAWNGWGQVQWGGGSGQLGQGDTIWMAGGTYTGGIDINGSGTAASRIYIRRALASESACTSATGWSAGFDSQVIFTCAGSTPQGFVFGAQGDYVTIDGGVAHEGMLFNMDHRNANGSSHASSGAISMHYATSRTGITFKNSKVFQLYHDTNPTYESNQIESMNLGAASSGSSVHRDILIQYVDFDSGANGIHFGHNDGLIIEHCKFHGMNQTASNAEGGAHSNLIYAHYETPYGFKNITIRYCDIYDNWNEGLMFGEDGARNNDTLDGNVKIYGNRFWDMAGANDGTSKCISISIGDNHINGFLVMNNTTHLIDTFINGNPSGTDYRVENNFDLDSVKDMTDFGSSNSDTTDDSLFVNPAANNYKLTVGTTAGNNLSSISTSVHTFDRDGDGVLRGGDGTWDRGAWEFGGTGQPPNITSNNAVWTNGIYGEYQIAIDGSASGYGCTNLPSGLQVSQTTGLVTGTPVGGAVTNQVVGLFATNATGFDVQAVLFTVHPIQPVFWASSYSLNFGDKETNATVSLNLTVSNAAPGTLLTGYLVSATSPFTVTPTNWGGVGGTTTTNLVVTYAPTAIGTNHGSLVFSSSGTQTIALQGGAFPIAPETNWTLRLSLLRAPMIETNNWVACTNSEGNFLPSGELKFGWVAPNSGTIKLWVSGLATNTANDSAFGSVNVAVIDPTNIWDVVPYPAAFTDRSYVHIRGNGTYNDPQYPSNSFAVFPGINTIILAGRETYFWMTNINIEFTSTGGPDATPPSVAITNPTTGIVVEEASYFGLAGTADDDSGVVSTVVISNATSGASFTATGTSPNWTNNSAFMLNLGTNIFRAYAADTNSNSTVSSDVAVKYQPPATSAAANFGTVRIGGQ